MKTLLFSTLFLLTSFSLAAQQKLIIHGKVDLVTQSKNFHIGQFSAPISADGTFEIIDSISSPQEALIYTDSSAASVIWLEAGQYNVLFSEYHLPNYRPVLMKIPVLKGPQSAMLYNDLQKEEYKGFFDTEAKVYDSASRKEQQKSAVSYMDSIFRNYPDAASLPSMLSHVRNFIGYDATKRYMQLFTPEQKQKSEVQRMQKDIDRQEKVSKEKIFEDFSMKTADNNAFLLSQLKGKKVILLDFWATGCGSCRAEHPKLIEWNKKYADKGLAIVCISLDDNKQDWLRSISQDKLEELINVSELSGWQTSLTKHYYIDFIPFRFLLKGDRTIIKVCDETNSGLNEKDIEDALSK